MEKTIEKLIKSFDSEREEFLEYVLRNLAVPIIKGDITKGKLKWRGIRLVNQKTLISNRFWVEQRGKRISSIIVNEYAAPNFINVANIPTQESIDNYNRAFDARLAYEKNCIAKYDYPDFMNKPSRPPKRGETMTDYAMRYGTSIKEMKDCWLAVESALTRDSDNRVNKVIK